MTRIPNALLRLAWTGRIREKPCRHLEPTPEAEPTSQVCDACVELGDRWVHLRRCLTCGYVGCCSSSKHDHARQHFEATGHPLIRPFDQPEMDWIWCYEDGALLDPR